MRHYLMPSTLLTAASQLVTIKANTALGGHVRAFLKARKEPERLREEIKELRLTLKAIAGRLDRIERELRR